MKIEIENYDACAEAVAFRKKFNSFQEAWENCPRGDWMLWIAKRVGVTPRTITLAKSRCAKTVSHLMKDDRSLKAVEVAEAFGSGNATEEELKSAAAAAAAYAAAAAAADAAAYAAAYAADAAAYAAAYAADAAAYAADARKNNQQLTADVCREILTKEVFEKLGLNNNDTK